MWILIQRCEASGPLGYLFVGLPNRKDSLVRFFSATLQSDRIKEDHQMPETSIECFCQHTALILFRLYRGSQQSHIALGSIGPFHALLGNGQHPAHLCAHNLLQGAAVGRQ
jgi:hypothetical protein